MAVHDRPAAFEGRDGMSYSVALEVDETGDAVSPVGGYFLFLRWRRMGAQGVEGHLESDFVETGTSRTEVMDALGRWSLAGVQRLLDDCLNTADGAAGSRRWWDVMREEGR